ncbi:GNAT family N-acetyltransferase [Achromobacter deleyi]|uniref:GNAT family N-acetyltransferase n=1 Tax=Achromobacter deleyi TaxID=1353891 RepID=A0A7T4E6G8_9BURK|nr:GNAT family N-acetyltransferase [Achromobacter deleyi]QQB37191.1 GNAT family N-acetyltransferase [Achromobacter deleyi]
MPASRVLRNSLEPNALVECFVKHPPEGFEILQESPLLAFVAPFDLLTTADDALKERVRGLPGYARWSRWLTLRANFIGTTVSEYALIPVDADPAAMVRALGQGPGRRRGLTIIKDLPHHSPLLGEAENANADAFAQACEEQGWVVVEGQALAYVPIDFSDSGAYVERLPKSARRYLTRKLRARDRVTVEKIVTGAAFSDDARIDSYYALYEEVYAQSSIHFDRLTRPFLAALLRDEAAQGIVFEYRHSDTGDLLGWNLCFDDGTRLVDKYIGLSYPGSRQVNLYFISWMVNLEYALQRGLTHYVAGWTDPGVKAMLGAKFTATRHAVYVRNPVLRMLARSFRKHFTADKQWLP